MNKFGSILANVVTVEQTQKARTASGPRKAWNPTTGADIRLWKDGAVFPSEALVARMDLNFTSRTVSSDGKGWDGDPGGYGFDIFNTQHYTGIQGAKFVAISRVARKEGKVDLFGSCNYYTQKDKDNNDIPEGANIGDPVSTVMDQGSTTFGKTLLTMLREVYNVVPNEEGFIDLHIVGQGEGNDQPFKNPNGSEIYYIPKEVKKGDKKGELTYERRENAEIYALIPAEGSTEATEATEVPESTEATANKVNDNPVGGAVAQEEPAMSAELLS